MRRFIPIVALLVVLAAAYWFDGILLDIRKEVGITFDVLPAYWKESIAKFAAGIAVAGLAWLLLVWSPPSRLTGLVFALAGGLLVFFWPLTWSLNLNLLGSGFDGLYVRLGEDGLLALVAPFLTALGLVRLMWPLPTFGARSRAAQQ
jgi:hypothetical protein